MLEMVILFMFTGGGLCLLFGLGYPLLGLFLYPLYKAQGGRKSLSRYLKDL